MFSENILDAFVASLRSEVLPFGIRTKSAILGSAALVLMLFSGSAAQAQCTAIGLNTTPLGPVVTQAAAMAVTNVSASVGSLVSSINSVDTVFLTQSNAFVWTPASPQPDQEGGGAWARGVGGHLAYSTTATAGNISFGVPVSGNVVCNTRTLEDFSGVQVGTDFARLNMGGWNLHFGSTAGSLGARTQDGTPGLSPPTNFRDSLQIPFLGVYGAASYGGFLIDGMVRGDFFQNEVSDDNHGLSGQRFDAHGIAMTANAAYNYRFANSWFIEPSAGISWSRTSVDGLNVPGNGVTGTPVAPGFVPPWVLTVNDIDSVLGRLSARVGTTFASGSVAWQPFASASAFHEFQGGVTSSLTSNFSTLGPPFSSLPTLNSMVSTGGLGTYGQFGLGIVAQPAGTGWVGYLRGDYRTGASIEGWSVNGGLRYQFGPDPGNGDLVAKAPIDKAAPASAAYHWTGLYIGGHFGAGWGSTHWTFTNNGDTTSPRLAGLIGGGDIGYNYQVGKWVLGIEGDGGWTSLRGAAPCPTGFFYSCEINTNWLSTATVRAGYTPWDRLLVYTKVGAAIAQDRAGSRCNTGSQPTIVPLDGCPLQTDSNTRVGWTAGWGSEFGLTQNWSVKSEIVYFDLGSDRYDITGIATDIRRNGVISTVGLNLRFGE